MAIRSFANRATRRIAKGDARRLSPAVRNAAADMLGILAEARSPHDMDLPGARLHALKGDRKGFYAVELSGRWRLVFQFDGGDAYEVEVVDYHLKRESDMDLYAVNSAVPAEQLEEFVEHLRSQPPHPGRIIRDRCLGGSISVEEAARKLNLEPVELEAVLACEAAVSPALAARLEAAGWSTADVWNNLQANYDRAQTRLRREREGSTSARSESAPGHVGRFAGTRTPTGNRSRRRLRRRG